MIMSGVYSNLNLCTHIYTHTQIIMRERERERESWCNDKCLPLKATSCRFESKNQHF